MSLNLGWALGLTRRLGFRQGLGPRHIHIFCASAVRRDGSLENVALEHRLIALGVGLGGDCDQTLH